MKKLCTILFALFISFSVFAEEVQISDDGSGIGTQTWTKENVYILNGFCFVNDGQVLTIEAGTVVKAQTGSAENASALIVAKGGKIMANGTADEPIVFTSVLDDGTLPLTTRGLWGGIVMLGKGQTNNAGPKNVEGISSTETRAAFGEEDANEKIDDNSGYLHYVSIRHGGSKLGDGDEINGLTMGACGTATEVSYCEILSNDDDGIEWFGGAPRMDHIVVAYCADDSYDIDHGCKAYGQFLVTVQGENEVGECFGEHDGGSGDGETSDFIAHTIFSNCTFLGTSKAITGGDKKAFQLRDNWSGEYHNSIFSNSPDGAYIEYRDDKTNTYERLTSGDITFANNIWNNIMDNTFESICIIADKESDPTADADKQAVWKSHLESNNNTLTSDLGLSETNLIPDADKVAGPVFDGLPEWFTVVDFKGAFNPNIVGHWAGGWTAAFANDTYNNDLTSSIEEFAAVKTNVRISPNPVSDVASIQFNNDGGKYSFKVYNLNGKLVKQITNITHSEFSFSKESLQSGLYIYELSNAYSAVSGKMLIK